MTKKAPKQQEEEETHVVRTVMSCTALRFNEEYDENTQQQTYTEDAMLIDMEQIVGISQYAEFADDGGVSKGLYTEIWMRGNPYPIVINSPYSEVVPIYMEFKYHQSTTHGGSK